MSEIVVPNEMAKALGVTPLRLRTWLRAGLAAGHPLLASHVHGSRWEFSRAEADRLIKEFRVADGAASASDVQLRAEDNIRRQLARMLGTRLRSRRLPLGHATVHVDAVADDGSVFAEIFARQGRLKPGQQKKVAIDALKLITLGRKQRRARLVLAFADETAAEFARGDGWLAEALRTWKVDVVVVEIPAALRASIKEAQGRQRMVNADEVVDDVAFEPGV